MPGKDLGDRLKRYRKDLGITQADLARRAEISPAYLSELEAGLGRRPSGEVLLRIADALDVTIAELLGRQVRPSHEEAELPESLVKFARDRDLPEPDVRMLASIRFRGEPPRTPRRWGMIYDSIVASRAFDEQ